jgi:hypothetical protein
MRPYLVLVTAVFAVVFTFVFTTSALAQLPYAGGCFYGCGPNVPRLTTPEISLQQFSPNPVGASNATTGLIAGATNSTLSQIQGSTSSVWTVPVWYQGGGAPMITPQIDLYPERIGREGRPMHEGPRPAAQRDGRVAETREVRTQFRTRQDRIREEKNAPQQEEARADWAFITGPSRTSTRVYGNDDVTRQNDKNGVVKYDGKTEKM